MISDDVVRKTQTLFACVGLLGRIDKAIIADTLWQVLHWLIANRIDVVINQDIAHQFHLDLALPNVHICQDNDFSACDLLIVVGGDGSILQAAQVLQGLPVPILGINRGRLGFLADILPDQFAKKLAQVFAGEYELDSRFMLTMQIWQDDVLVAEDIALNDIVLHAGKSVHTIDYQLRINGQDVYRHHADGLIVATPTGSTAYSLSAGGPIIHPSLNAICLSPMYAHTLTSRPLVVSADSQISIIAHKDSRTQPMVSCDGKTSVALNQHDVLKILKFDRPLNLLHPIGFNFYEACRTKLNWSLYSDEFTMQEQNDDER